MSCFEFLFINDAKPRQRVKISIATKNTATEVAFDVDSSREISNTNENIASPRLPSVTATIPTVNL